MKPNHILFVPGKNPKPPADLHRGLTWRCLLRGVEKCDAAIAADMAAHADTFQLIPWNGIYYGRVKQIEKDLPWIEELLRRTGPSPDDIRAVRSWRNKKAWLTYTLADLFPFLIPLTPDPAVKSTIEETRRYFENHDNIGCQVRELLKAPLRRIFKNGERVLVICHSMGSVIAYDALWELWHEEKLRGQVDLFLTLGSPLGMRFVQNRLIGFRNHDGQRFPGNIRRWQNVAAEGDLTALDPAVHDDFKPMLDLGLTELIQDKHAGIYTYFRDQNGLNAHRSYGYLVHDQVGRIIAHWWRGE
jgi:hypothetical protein